MADKNGNPVSDVAPVGKGLSRAAARDSDVIVIGAGASGCNTAWHLRQSNRSVLVLEAGPAAASEASHAAAGFVAHWTGLQNKGWGLHRVADGRLRHPVLHQPGPAVRT